MLRELDWDTNDLDGDKYLSVHNAAKQGNAALLELLMKSGADVDGPSSTNSLDKAASRGYVKFVRALLSFRVALNSSTKRCYLLNGATVKAHCETTQLLLSKLIDTRCYGPGLDVRRRDAVWSDILELSRLLLDRGADFHCGSTQAYVTAYEYQHYAAQT